MEPDKPGISDRYHEILAEWQLSRLRQQIRLGMFWFLEELAKFSHREPIDALAFVVDGGNVSLGSAWAYRSEIQDIENQHEDDYSVFGTINPAEYPNWDIDIQSFPGLYEEIARLSRSTESEYERFGEAYLFHGWSQRVDRVLTEFLLEALADSTLRLQKVPLTDDALVFVHRHDAYDLEQYFTLKRTIGRDIFAGRLRAYEEWLLAGADPDKSLN